MRDFKLFFFFFLLRIISTTFITTSGLLILPLPPHPLPLLLLFPFFFYFLLHFLNFLFSFIALRVAPKNQYDVGIDIGKEKFQLNLCEMDIREYSGK